MEPFRSGTTMSWDRSRSLRLAVAGLLLIGVVLRLLEYFDGRPLWLDEAMLALNIGRQSAVGLLSPLAYEQSAPLLFLLAVKGVIIVAGMGEHALRVVPLLAGLLLPWLIWRMARSLVSPEVGLVAAALAVVSVPLIYYSAELRSYGLDAVVCAALMLRTASVRAAPERSSAWWALASTGLIGLLLATPTPLIEAGAILGLAADARVRATPGAPKRIVLLLAAWGAGAALTYFLVNRSVATNPYMLSFWRGTFLDPGAADFPERLRLLARSILAPLPSFPEWLRLRWIVVAGAAGLILLVRRSGIAAALQVSGPFVALALASAAGKYPIAIRLLLFLTPCTFVLVSVLIVEGLRAVRLEAPKAAGVGVLLVAFWGAGGVLRNLRTPRVEEEGRATARRIQAAPADEPVYVLSVALPAWAYYSTDWSRPDTVRLKWFERLAVGSGPASRNDIVALAAESPPARALEYESNGRLELIGVRSGLRYRAPKGFDSWSPNPSWAGKEADRIQGTRRRYIWIYATHWVGQLVPVLRVELARRGMVVVESMYEQRAVALRVRMPNQLVDPRYRAAAAARP